MYDGLFLLQSLGSHEQVSIWSLPRLESRPGTKWTIAFDSTTLLLVLIRSSLPHPCLSCHFWYYWVCRGIGPRVRASFLAVEPSLGSGSNKNWQHHGSPRKQVRAAHPDVKLTIYFTSSSVDMVQGVSVSLTLDMISCLTTLRPNHQFGGVLNFHSFYPPSSGVCGCVRACVCVCVCVSQRSLGAHCFLFTRSS